MLQAFHNDTNIQKKYLNRVKAHYKADEIIKGIYWENGRGCAVGCTIEGSDHSRYEKELGIPRQLAHLEDRIFENLENGEAKEFPLKFLSAIKVGADLSPVLPKFMIWLLSDKKDGVMQYARPDGKKAIQTVVDLYKRKLKGEEITTDEWVSARRAAVYVYDTATYAAAYDAAAYDAAAATYAAAAAAYAAAAAAYAAAAYDAAAYDAADAAADAADAAADADAVAKRKHYKKMAKKLISLLKAAK